MYSEKSIYICHLHFFFYCAEWSSFMSSCQLVLGPPHAGLNRIDVGSLARPLFPRFRGSKRLKLSGIPCNATTTVETQYPAALRQNPHYPFERATYFRLSESGLQISFLMSRERNIGEPLNQSCRQFLDRYSRIRRSAEYIVSPLKSRFAKDCH